MRFRSIWRQLLVWLGRISRPDVVAQKVALHPAPDSLKPGCLVVVGTRPPFKWVCFRCPGGCGEVIQLALNPSRRPCWSVTIDRLDRPTIAPSVRQLNDCRCHFWIRQGRVEWCADSPQRQLPDGSRR